MEKIINGASRLLNAVAGLGIVLIMVLVTLNILLRTFLNRSILVLTNMLAFYRRGHWPLLGPVRPAKRAY